jgi:hypothetical protein
MYINVYISVTTGNRPLRDYLWVGICAFWDDSLLRELPNYVDTDMKAPLRT